MNLILFEPGEIGAPLSRTDPRALHLVKILRRKPGDLFDAGIVDGPLGKGRIEAITGDTLVFRFDRVSESPPPDPIHLLVALPRPQTARKILNEAASLGVASIRFFRSEKGEPGYATSTLWSGGEWRRHLVDGAGQAFDTRLPEVVHHVRLGDAIAALPEGLERIVLDNYEATRRLVPSGAQAQVLAFGPERGWSPAERTLLRKHRFELAHLGPRVLRTETAIVAAIAIAKSIR